MQAIGPGQAPCSPKGPKKLQAGREIDALLEELAPLVLCLRNHQYQAPDLVARWKENIYSARQSQQADSRRQRSRRNTARNPEDLLELQEQYAVLTERITSTLDNLHHIQGRLLAQETVVRPGSRGHDAHVDGMWEPNLDQWMTLVSTSARRLHRIIDDETPLSSSPRLATARGGRAQGRERDEPRHSVRATGAEQRADRPLSSHPPRSSRSTTSTSTSPAEADPPAAPTATTTAGRSVLPASHSSRSNRPVTTRPRHRVSRRSIEEDQECGICLETLVGNSNNSEDTGADENAFSNENEEGRTDDLVWCKARCGNNFHSECLSQWIDECYATDKIPSCPSCRGRWRD